MLSNLASYLLGYSVEPTGVADQQTQETSPLRLNAVEGEEDDWLLVNASEIEEGDENSLFIRSRSPLISSSRNSRSGSVSSLPCNSMEESWFVTPPPCFTSSGPIVIETSSLENLLIEHPSMSVYHHRSPPTTPRLPRARSTSPEPSGPIVQPPAQPLQPINRRQPAQTLHEQQEHLHCLELKAVHKYQKRQSVKVNRNQLERRNKVKEFNSGNRRQRRSDRQQQHSGANNNRKCC